MLQLKLPPGREYEADFITLADIFPTVRYPYLIRTDHYYLGYERLFVVGMARGYSFRIHLWRGDCGFWCRARGNIQPDPGRCLTLTLH